MIAEIRNKVSKSNSNLTELSEDELTGNFFGHLRYIPFNKGLKPVLKNAVFPTEAAFLIDTVDVDYWNENIEFWPYHSEGELDAYIEFDNLAMGIEVKYTSGLSSDDDIYYSLSDEKQRMEQSRNQLQRESRIVTSRANQKPKILLLIGDAMACADIYSNIGRRNLLQGSDVLFCYATWQSLLRELRKLELGDPYSALVVSDLVELLKKKGFEQFHSMKLEAFGFVSSHEFYEFDYKIESGFSFENNLQIEAEGDYHYEFR